MATVIEGCKNGYTKENISDKFCESAEEQEVCNTCPYLQYKNGMMFCTKQKGA